MTFFEQELRRFFENQPHLTNTKYIGRACYAELGDDLRLKVHFSASKISDHYDALLLEVINRQEGVVDKQCIHFADLLGVMYPSNPNFQSGLTPYIWEDGRNVDWYVYKPSAADYDILRGAVRDYAQVFAAPTQAQGQHMI